MRSVVRNAVVGCLGIALVAGPCASAAPPASAPAGVSPYGLFDALLASRIPASELLPGSGAEIVVDAKPTSQETAHNVIARVEVRLGLGYADEIYYAIFSSRADAVADVSSGPPGKPTHGLPEPSAIGSGSSISSGSKIGYTIIDFTDRNVVGGALTFSRTNKTDGNAARTIALGSLALKHLTEVLDAVEAEHINPPGITVSNSRSCFKQHGATVGPIQRLRTATSAPLRPSLPALDQALQTYDVTLPAFQSIKLGSVPGLGPAPAAKTKPFGSVVFDTSPVAAMRSEAVYLDWTARTLYFGLNGLMAATQAGAERHGGSWVTWGSLLPASTNRRVVTLCLGATTT